MTERKARGIFRRELGGATMVGSWVHDGAGVFVSIGIAAGAAGPSVILAIGLAAPNEQAVSQGTAQAVPRLAHLHHELVLGENSNEG